MLKLSGDPHMAAITAAMNRQVSASLIAQAVMEAITRNPADASDAVATALRAAPELRNEITANLVTAFPTLRSTFTAPPVRQVAPAPLPVRSVAAPVPTASSTPAAPADPYADRDPLEGLNRAIFAFNDFLDTWVMVPVAEVYRFIMPETLRLMGRNFFENLREPVVFLNDVLQGDFDDAGTALGRLAINSTIGILGFFEVAERVDLKKHTADFGQTLHSYGSGSGPFLVLPVLGASTMRDTVGMGVDFFLNPLTYLIDMETRLYLEATRLVVEREKNLNADTARSAAAKDPYAAMRAAWFKRREIELRKEVPPAARPSAAVSEK
jgi:phospholipid-binding lipoprotein MlaA